MSYFNQHKYSKSSVSSEEIEEIVEKGHKNKLNIDIAKFEELCKKFRDKKELKIKKLSGQDKEDFNLAVSYVHLLYGTDYYTHLYEKVKKYFNSVISVKPGTIGSYFAGCLVTSNKEKNSDSTLASSCNISCAGSMPLPRDEEGWSFCDKAVFMAEKGKNGYDFSVLKPATTDEEMNPAYLFVESKSLDDFSGFTDEEKTQIKALGCKNVKLVGYSQDMSYSELYSAPTDVHKIKHRYKHSKRDSKRNETNSLFRLVFILLLILFILFCIAVYKYMEF